MATIALYAGKLNQMSSLIGEVKKGVDDYSSELFSLKSKALNIRKSVCDLDDVIGMVQASTEIQEKKIESLEDFSQKTEEFTAEVVRIDEEAAAVINQNKEDFYNKYHYLKPDAEKNFLEMCFDIAAEWCKEHWQEIIDTVLIIVGAALTIVAVLATGGTVLAIIAVISTIGATALNIADVWGNIDNPTFNTLQSVFNWTSTISNGVYALGMGYNKKVQGKGGPSEPVNKSGKPSVIYGTDDIANYQYNMIENPEPLAEMPNQSAKNFYGGRYNMEVLQEDRIMYRAGNAENPYGRWFTSEPPASVANVRIDTAVKMHWTDPITSAYEASSYIDNVYAIKYQRGLLFIQDLLDRKEEHMWEDITLCKHI